MLLVDDVTTDGRSKAGAVAALRQAGPVVADVFVLLDYALYTAEAGRPADPFLSLHALARWQHLHDALITSGRLDAAQARTLSTFAQDPVGWSIHHGGTGA